MHSLITDFHEWVAWSPWEGLDPDMRRDYSETDRGVGARYAWEGNRKAGKGSMEIVGDEPQAITIDLRFDKPFPAHNTTQFLLTPAGRGTKVQWRMTGEQGLMMRLFSMVMPMDSMIGKDFEKGLAQLKAVAEA